MPAFSQMGITIHIKGYIDIIKALLMLQIMLTGHSQRVIKVARALVCLPNSNNTQQQDINAKQFHCK